MTKTLMSYIQEKSLNKIISLNVYGNNVSFLNQKSICEIKTQHTTKLIKLYIIKKRSTSLIS